MARLRAKLTDATTITLTTTADVSRQTLERWASAARRRLPRLTGSVSVAIVSPTVSRRLNRRYRRRDMATNVLSFVHPPDRSAGPERLAGEILLCPTIIRRAARRQHRPYRPYLKFLLDHGFIHLLDLDHRTPSERRRWRRFERRLASQP